MLVIFSGLPGVGKTSIARELARQTGAVHLRIDSIEQVIREWSGGRALEDVGYRVAYALAEDNLRLGRIVVADSVNPIRLTRDAWVEVARRAGVATVEVEVRCSDPVEHRQRVEGRVADIPGLRLPTWSEVVAREYQEWDREPVFIETAGRTIGENVAALLGRLRACH